MSALSIYIGNQWGSTTGGASIVLFETINTFYTFWNSQLLWVAPLAVSCNLSVIQVKALDYLSALSPLFLIVFLWAIIKIYHGSVLVTALKKLFHNFLRKFKV